LLIAILGLQRKGKLHSAESVDRAAVFMETKSPIMANMTSERIRQLWKAEPFQKFTIHMSDGRQLPVEHREFLAVSPSGRTMVVYQPDDSLDIVDLMLVTDLELRPNGRRGRRGRRG